MKKEVVGLAAVSTAATVVVVAAVLRQWKRKEQQCNQTQRIIHKFATECATPVSKLWQIADALVSDMHASLSSNHSNKNLNMLVSYVDSLPNG